MPVMPPRPSDYVQEGGTVLVPKGMAKSPMPTALTISPTVRAQALKEGTALLNPLKDDIQGFLVKTPGDYQVADELLTRVITARKRWADKLAPILNPIKKAIKEMQDAGKGAKELLDEVDEPLEQYETHLRSQMKAFKVEEQRQITAQAQEQRRLQAEADRLAVRVSTPQVKRALTQTLQRLEQAEPVPEPTVAEGTGTRTKPAWKIADWAKFLNAVGSGDLPDDCVIPNQVRMNQYFKEDPEQMKSWPGISIFEDVIIVKR